MLKSLPSRYLDEVRRFERVTEFTLRGGSVSYNVMVAEVRGLRVFSNGCWFITSCQGCRDLTEVRERLRKLAPSVSAGVGSFRGAEVFSGRVALGRELRESELSEFIESAKGLCIEYEASGLTCDAVIKYVEVLREIKPEGIEPASELKRFVDVSVGVKFRGLRVSYGSASISFFPGFTGVGVVEELLKVARERAVARSKGKSLKLTEFGGAEVILDSEAFAALVHEVSHLLEGTHGRGLVGVRVFSGEPLSMYDDPRDLRKPSARYFDDECVPTGRRWLIEGGRVVDLHHTITSAAETGSSPGSAYGLFHPPRPYHSSLVVSPGDWSDREIVEETRSGYLVRGVAAAFLEEGLIRLIPEATYRVSKGEVTEPVIVRAVKIPLTRPINLLALGRRKYLRTSYEDLNLVSEEVPSAKIRAYIE